MRRPRPLGFWIGLATMGGGVGAVLGSPRAWSALLVGCLMVLIGAILMRPNL